MVYTKYYPPLRGDKKGLRMWGCGVGDVGDVGDGGGWEGGGGVESLKNGDKFFHCNCNSSCTVQSSTSTDSCGQERTIGAITQPVTAGQCAFILCCRCFASCMSIIALTS